MESNLNKFCHLPLISFSFEWLFKGFFKCCLSNAFWNSCLFIEGSMKRDEPFRSDTLYSSCVLEFSIILNAKGNLRKQKQWNVLAGNHRDLGLWNAAGARCANATNIFIFLGIKPFPVALWCHYFGYLFCRMLCWRPVMCSSCEITQLVFSQLLSKVIQSLMLTLNLRKGRTISFTWNI